MKALVGLGLINSTILKSLDNSTQKIESIRMFFRGSLFSKVVTFCALILGSGSQGGCESPSPGESVKADLPPWASTVKKWHVVRADPSDESGKSFTSIKEAWAEVQLMLADGLPVRLEIGPGVYREWLGKLMDSIPNKDVALRVPLWIEGSGPAQTIISGALEDTQAQSEDWELVEGSEDVYGVEWEHNWERDAGPWIDGHLVGFKEEATVREQIYLNGKPLRLVLAEKYQWSDVDGKGGKRGTFKFDHFDESRLNLEPGQFTVVSSEESPDDVTNKLYIRLPEGITWEAVPSLEIPSYTGRRYESLVDIREKDNLIIRNLGIQYGNAGVAVASLALSKGKNILLESIKVTNCVNVGISLKNLENVELRNVESSDNGIMGINAGESKNLTLSNCVTNGNNYRGAWEGFIHWHPSGVKLGNCHDVKVVRHIAMGNHANGVWNDVYCTNILFSNCFLYGNRRVGAMLELADASKGGNYVVQDSIIARNGAAGVFISMVLDTKITGSLLAHNGTTEVIEDARVGAEIAYKGHDRKTIKVSEMTGHRIENNILIPQSGGFVIGNVHTRTTPDNFMSMIKATVFSHNQVSPEGKESFLYTNEVNAATYEELLEKLPEETRDQWAKNTWTAPTPSDSEAGWQAFLKDHAAQRNVPWPTEVRLATPDLNR